MTACVDSDVLIDYFDGIPAAAEELSRYDGLVISRITRMEVLVGAPTGEHVHHPDVTHLQRPTPLTRLLQIERMEIRGVSGWSQILFEFPEQQAGGEL